MTVQGNLNLPANTTLTQYSTTQMTVTGNLTMNPGAILNHAANIGATTATGPLYALNLAVLGTLDMLSGSSITLDGLGYPAANGPGRGFGSDGSGAGHGGPGTYDDEGAAGGAAYDSLTNPSDLGSGGGNGGSGGAGGGAILLNISGALQLNGSTISANGGNFTGGSYGGGGSGGTINITAGSVGGAGTLRANGGSGLNYTGAGAGGRIALYVTGPSGPGLTMTAYGGNGYQTVGPPGTVYSLTAGQPQLTVSDGGSLSSYTTPITAATAGTSTLSVSTLSLANARLNLSGLPLVVLSSAAFNGTSFLTFSSMSLNSNLNLPSNTTLTQAGTTPFTVNGNLTMMNGSVLTHAANAATRLYAVNAAVTGNMTIQAGASVNASGLGYSGGTSGKGSGTGFGWGLATAGGGGGGYGGAGGMQGSMTPGGAAYGSVSAPNDSGSGGGGGAAGGNGGGQITLNVAGTLTLSGTLNASGSAGSAGGSYGGGGGSGGSVDLVWGSLTGSGSITAAGGAGGNATLDCGGGGGGGRVSGASGSQFPGGIVNVSGGAAGCASASNGSFGSSFDPTINIPAPVVSTFTGTFGSALTTNWNPNGNPATTLYLAQVSDQPDFSIDVISSVTANNSATFLGQMGSPTYARVAAMSNGLAATEFLVLGSTRIAGTSGTSWVGPSGGDWNNPANWSPAAVPSPEDDVTINANATVLTYSSNAAVGFHSLALGSPLGQYSPTLILSTGTLSLGSLDIFLNATLMQNTTFQISLSTVTLYSGGILTHSANNSTQQAVINISVANTLAMLEGSNIIVDGLGYAAESGPGAGVGDDGTGAGHGGQGGIDDSGYYANGRVYDSLLNPTNIGSGGGGRSATGGAGGGAVILNVGGTLKFNGNTISANGISHNLGSSYGGGGSGGTINISAASLSGTASIYANGGGALSYTGGGGGGRIAVVTSGTNNAALTMTAYGGSGDPTVAAAGTIYTASGGQSQLTVAGAGSATSYATFISSATAGTQTLSLSTLTISSAKVTFSSGPCPIALVVQSSTSFSGTSALNVASMTLSGGLVLPSNTTLTETSTAPLTINGNVTMLSGSLMNHAANAATRQYALNLLVNGSMNINSGASITLDSLGYQGGGGGGGPSSGSGPGGGSGTSNVTSGGGHGGSGGAGGYLDNIPGGRSYDFLWSPSDLGSGGGGGSGAWGIGGAGGGEVTIDSTGGLTVNGTISANGGMATPTSQCCASSGGAGGSIYILGSLGGNGTISANGGTGANSINYGGGGGGGGRIAGAYGWGGILSYAGGAGGTGAETNGLPGNPGTLAFPLALLTSTPTYPLNGKYVKVQPNFDWRGPSTTTAVALDTAAVFEVQVSSNDPTFGAGNIVLQISTPLVVASTSFATADGAYISTFTLSGGATYYWRVQTQDPPQGAYSPWSQVYSFLLDFGTPTASGFESFSSSGGAVLESQFNNLAAGAGAQITVQEAASGLAVSTAALTFVGDGQDGPSYSASFGVLYSTDAAQTWIDWSTYTVALSANGQSFAGLAALNHELYAVGPNGNEYASADGVSWSAVGDGGSSLNAVTEFHGQLYAGSAQGTVMTLSSPAGGWSTVYSGPGAVASLAVFNGNLYAAGSAPGDGGFIAASNDGVHWNLVYSIASNSISSLAVYRGMLFAGGANYGAPVYETANGSVWSQVALGYGEFSAFAAYNGSLYASANGGIYATTDGVNWSLTGAPGQASSMVVFDDKLYAGVTGALLETTDAKTWNQVFSYPGIGVIQSLVGFQGALYAGGQGTILALKPLPASMTGSAGTLSPQTLTASGLSLAQSTSAQTCGGASPCAATNQVIFTASDLAGTVRRAGPYAILVDAVTPQAISTPTWPRNQEYIDVQPNFLWVGPSTSTAAALPPNAAFELQVSNNDPSFASAAIQVSTPVIVSTRAPTADGAYLSTFTLVSGATYYWRVRIQDALEASPWSQVNSFVTDFGTPSASGFQSLNSSGAAILEAQFNNLAAGASAQITVQDLISGLAVSSTALYYAGDGHDDPVRTSGYGVMYSTNAGQTWIDLSTVTTSIGGPAVGSLSGFSTFAVFNGTLYGTGRYDGGVYSTVDGVHWSATGVGTYIYSLAVFKGKLYATDLYGGQGPRLWASADGVHWSAVNGAGGVPISLAVFNGKLYAGTASGISVSADGSDWTTSNGGNPIGSNGIGSLVVFNGRLYAVDSVGNLFVSEDGDEWYPDGAAAGYATVLTTFNGKLYAASSSNGQVFASPDGANWSATNKGAYSGIGSMAVFNGKLYAGDGSGRLYASVDGTNWTSLNGGNPIATAIPALAPFNGKLYAADSNGLIYQITPVPALLGGSDGTTMSEALAATSLNLAQSTNTQVCGGVSPCGATNQVVFTVSDLAGGVRKAGPYAILVDTITPLAISTPSAPANGSYSNQREPSFQWNGPSAAILSAIQNPLYLLQVSKNDPAFGSANLVINASTAATLTSPFVYVSTVSLAEASTYYWRVATQNGGLGSVSPWSQVFSFVTDYTSPTVSGFETLNSTGGAVARGQFNNLLSGVTAQITVQDSLSGLSMTAGAGSPLTAIPGTVGLWHFDEGSGSSSTDTSGNGNTVTGIGSNGTSRTSGLFGSAVAFNGNGSYVTVTNSTLNISPSAFTFEAWVYLQGGGGIVAGLFGGGVVQSNCGGGPRIFVGGANTVSIQSAPCQASVNGNISMAMNQWTHIAVVGSGSTQTIYINGVQDTTGSLALTATGSNNMVFGESQGNAGFFTGKLDEIRFLDFAETAAQVAQDATAAASLPYSAQYTTNAGATWQTVSSSIPAPGVYASLTGSNGTTSPQTLSLHNLSLVQSTNALTCNGAAVCGATDQVLFSVSDAAGNVKVTAPYAMLVDAYTPLAVSTPASPANGSYTDQREPTFQWIAPSTTVLSGISKTFYALEVSKNDPAFGAANLVETLSTAATLSSPFVYASTVSLAEAATYYWRVATQDAALGTQSPWSQAFSFVTDFTSPTVSGFIVYSSTGGAIGRGEFENLASGVTAQITVQDTLSGLAITTTNSATSTPYFWALGTGNGLTRINTVTGSQTTFSSLPGGTAGAVDASGNLWVVANISANLAYKVNASNGSIMVSNSLPFRPNAIAIDPYGNVWVGGDNNEVYELDGNSGNIIGSNSAACNSCQGVAVDASGNVWVANYNNNNVTEMNNAGSVIGSYTVPGNHWGIAVDGSGNIWVTNMGSNSVSKLSGLNGSVIGTYPVGVYADGIAVDGSGNVWVSNLNSSNVVELNSSGSIIGTFPMSITPQGVAIDASGHVWISDYRGQGVVELSEANGSTLATYPVNTANETYGADVTGFALQTFVVRHAMAGYSAQVSNNAGATWQTISSTVPAATPYISLSGPNGSTSPQQLNLFNLNLVQSTNTMTCNGAAVCGATDQVVFSVSDVAGNVKTSFPYAILVDTTDVPVVFAFSNIASTSILQGNETPLLKMTLNDQAGTLSWSALTLQRLGLGSDFDVDEIRIRKDILGTGVFSTSAPQLSLPGARFTSGLSTVTLAAPEIVTGSTQAYFVSVFVDSAATVGDSVGVQLQSPASFAWSSPVRTQSAVFPAASSTTTIADNFNDLILTPTNAAPITAGPGAANVSLLQISAQTNVGTSQFANLLISRTGSGSDGDISHIKVYRSAGLSSSFNPAQDSLVSSGVDFFQNAAATVTFICSQSSATVSTSQRVYYIVADLSGGAGPGDTLGVSLSSTTSVRLTGADAVLFSTTPFASTPMTVAVHNTLNVAISSAMPSLAFIGSEVPAASLLMSVNVGVAQVQQLQLSRIGASASADVSMVRVWLDNGSGVFNPTGDTLLGQAAFASGANTLSINIATQTITPGSPANLFVTYVISPTANVSDTLGVSFSNSAQIGVLGSFTSVAGNFPFNSNLGTISATINTLFSAFQSAVGGNPLQGQTGFGLLRLQLWTDQNFVLLKQLTLSRIGSGSDGDASSVALYAAPSGAALFTVAQSTLVSSGADAFANGSAVLTLPSALQITPSTQTFFLAVNIAPSAGIGDTFGISLASAPLPFSVSAPNLVSTTSLPAASPLAAITQFPNTVTLSTAGAPPASVSQGQSGVAMMQFTLNTNVSNAVLSQVKIDRIGTLADAYVSAVEISQNGLLISPATMSFSGGTVVLPITPQTITPSGKTFTVSVNLSTAATPLATLGVQWGDHTYFTVNPPNAVSTTTAGGGGFPVQSPLTTVAKPAVTVLVTGTTLAPATAVQGTLNVPMLKLQLAGNTYSTSWTGLTLTRTGNGPDADVSNIRIYYDSVGDGVLRLDGTDPTVGASTTAVFSNGVAQIALSTQTITTSTQTYFITVDVSPAAAPQTAFGTELASPGALVFPAPDQAAGTNFPVLSSQTTVLATQAGLIVAARDVAPGVLQQGATDQPMLALTLETTEYALVLSSLRIERLGTGSDPDIAAVRVFADNGSGVFSPSDVEVDQGTNVFVSGVAQIPLLAQTINTAAKTYFIAVDAANLASVGKTFGLAVSSAADLSVSAPNYVETAGFPFQVQPPLTITKEPRTVYVSGSNAAAAGIFQGAVSAPFLYMALSVSGYQSTLQSLEVAKSGTVADASVLRVGLYADSNNDQVFEPGVDAFVASGTFSAGAVTLTGLALSVLPSTAGYFITIDMSSNAVPGQTVALAVSAPNFLGVDPIDTVAPFAALVSTLAAVIDVRTPTTPLVTPDDGHYLSYVTELPFTWSSGLATSSGTITSAQYAIGTSAGASDVLGWTATGVTPAGRDVTAQGLLLVTGTTYYVAVKATSSFGFTSPAGVSSAILEDSIVPVISGAMTATQDAGDAVVIDWPAAETGPSGLEGYLLQYRRGESPLWYDAQTGAVSSQQAATAKPLARKPAAAAPDLYNLNSAVLTTLTPDTYFYRVLAYNGAGVPSSQFVYSNRLVLGALSGGVLSAADNYPNPFDSRKEATDINYTLNQNIGVSLTIYDVYGDRVRSWTVAAGSTGGQAGTNDLIWDGTDSSGRKVSKGVYLGVLDAGGNKTTLKIAVIH